MRLGFRPLAMLLIALGILNSLPSSAQEPTLTPTALGKALAAKPEGETADKLASQVRAWFGRNNQVERALVRTEEREVAWAIDSPSAQSAPTIVSQDGRYRQPLQRI